MKWGGLGRRAASVGYVPRRLSRVTLLAVALLLVVGCRTAFSRALLPPPGKIFAGEAGQPVSQYVAAVGKHPAIYQAFEPWGGYVPGPFEDAAAVRSRLMMHISTRFGASEVITPGQIARGAGDRWLIALNSASYASGHPWYVRLMAEMDAYWNPYSAFNADGSRRDADHSTAAFRRAWQRVTVIMRGGSLHGIDRTLRALSMPPLAAAHDLPRPQVAMLWVPQVAGAPDVSGNQPRDYWPGSRYVDWVGTDFYSNAPNFAGLTALYDAYPRFPFVFGEYAMWDSPDGAGFVNSLFGWIGGHRRTRMLIYNQGFSVTGPFRLYRFPAAARALRAHLASPTFPPFAPDW